jgi:hypothetical protein
LSEPFTPLQSQNPELIAQLQALLPGSVFEQLNGSLWLDQQRLERLERENRLLRQLRRLELLEKYGPAGEHLSDAQLELLELEPGVSRAEVEAESQRAPLKGMRQTNSRLVSDGCALRHGEPLNGVRAEITGQRGRRHQGAAPAWRAFQAAGVNSATRLTG